MTIDEQIAALREFLKKQFLHARACETQGIPGWSLRHRDLAFKIKVLDMHVPSREDETQCKMCAAWGTRRSGGKWPCWHVRDLLEAYASEGQP